MSWTKRTVKVCVLSVILSFTAAHSMACIAAFCDQENREGGKGHTQTEKDTDRHGHGHRWILRRIHTDMEKDTDRYGEAHRRTG